MSRAQITHFIKQDDGVCVVMVEMGGGGGVEEQEDIKDDDEICLKTNWPDAIDEFGTKEFPVDRDIVPCGGGGCCDGGPEA